ncbi:hypothetical protein M1466_02600 [Candidatus Dependentiae bacterium]|nr:hypothetical protein [Candidatus Dependentiae bacterium]
MQGNVRMFLSPTFFIPLFLALAILVVTHNSLLRIQRQCRNITAWQRVLLILEYDRQQGDFIWQGDTLLVYTPTVTCRWFWQANALYRHDGRSQHAICLMRHIQQFGRQGNFLVVQPNDGKELRWPYCCVKDLRR